MKVIHPDQTQVAEPSKRALRFLVSSTFTDTAEERNIFMSDVTPPPSYKGYPLFLSPSSCISLSHTHTHTHTHTHSLYLSCSRSLSVSVSLSHTHSLYISCSRCLYLSLPPSLPPSLPSSLSLHRHGQGAKYLHVRRTTSYTQLTAALSCQPPPYPANRRPILPSAALPRNPAETRRTTPYTMNPNPAFSDET